MTGKTAEYGNTNEEKNRKPPCPPEIPPKPPIYSVSLEKGPTFNADMCLNTVAKCCLRIEAEVTNYFETNWFLPSFMAPHFLRQANIYACLKPHLDSQFIRVEVISDRRVFEYHKHESSVQLCNLLSN